MKTGERREGERRQVGGRKKDKDKGFGGSWTGARRQSCIDSSPSAPCVFQVGLGATTSASGPSPSEPFSTRGLGLTWMWYAVWLASGRREKNRREARVQWHRLRRAKDGLGKLRER